MGLFSKKETRENMILKASFDHIRQDFGNTFSWLTYLNQRQAEHDSKLDYTQKRLENIELYLSQIPNLNAQMRQILDLHYNYKTILKRLNEIEEKMRKISFNAPQNQLVELKSKLDILEKKKEDIKSNLKEKMLRTITRNSKDYIKSTALSLIRRYEKISAFKLKEIIVEEQALCSKSTFYRILEELEQREDVDVLREGKEKVFFIKITPLNSR